VLNDSKYNVKILFQLLLDTAQFEFTLKEVRAAVGTRPEGRVMGDDDRLTEEGTRWSGQREGFTSRNHVTCGGRGSVSVGGTAETAARQLQAA